MGYLFPNSGKQIHYMRLTSIECCKYNSELFNHNLIPNLCYDFTCINVFRSSYLTSLHISTLQAQRLKDDEETLMHNQWQLEELENHQREIEKQRKKVEFG